MHRVVIAGGRAGRAALGQLLVGSEFEVVAGVDSGRDPALLVERVRPDLVLVDLEHTQMLPSLMATLRRAQPSLPVVVLGDAADHDCVVSAVGHGARGFLLRATPSEDLLQALRVVVDGGLVIDPAVARHVVDVVTRGVRLPGAHGLTRAEERILIHLPDRLTNREIGERIGISKSTVKTHLRNIYRKLDVGDRLEAATFATQQGLA